MARKSKSSGGVEARTESYDYPDATLIARPEAGQQSRFKKKKPKATYRYDSSLAPEMNWDGQNPAREHGEWLIRCIEDAAKLTDTNPPFTFKEPRQFSSADGRIVATVRGLADATEQLKRLSQPYLDWSGKAERLSFNVPTLPLFMHERLSTQAIIETLKSHRKDAAQASMFDLFGDPQRPLADAITKAYEHQDKWVNRLILGDSLVVMNSLLQYEGLGGQVQMIYIDPPYGVKFGSNFQPFVRQRNVSENKDEDMTREPEMVKAYRDTWQLGIHSYISYLKDRLKVARDLLTPSGSIFIQISDENLHHVTAVASEIFGSENFVSVVPFRKKTMPLGAKHLESICDYLIWFARDKERVKFRKLYEPMTVEGDSHWNYVELPDGTRRKMTSEEVQNHTLLPEGADPIQLVSLYPAGVNQTGLFKFPFRGKSYEPPAGNSWFTHPEGMQRLAEANRIEPYESGETLRYVLKLSDSPFSTLTNMWADTSAPSDKTYVVQTSQKVIQRCMLMTTDPGDLVVDPTCGGGSTALVAEKWGRRWITTDVSRVPLALTRARLLTETYSWFELVDPTRGPSGGFRFSRKKNRRGQEVGGVFPYISKGSIANDEPIEELVIVDRPDEASGVTRVTGPFCVEATIPTPLDLDGDGEPDDGSDLEERTSFVERMLDTLRRAPIIQLGKGRNVTLRNIRQPAKTLALSAEAMVEATSEGQKVSLDDVIAVADEQNKNALPLSQRAVAIVFGPENGAVSERLVYEAAQEAAAKRFTHLYVIGFSIQPNAEHMIGQCEAIFDIPATWVPVTPDVVMGDLLKTTRASQIFSIGGRPDIRPTKLAPEKASDPQRWQVALGGLDTFDPVTMEVSRLKGDDVPCWMLDTNYNGRVFMASQVFFPRTKAWDSLKTALKATHDASVWDHLAGDTSAPFEAGEHNTIAVKVIDDRGNELMVVKKLDEV
ncbi:MAG: site-specific DNA-methyltransferase [Methylobacterium sp.]|nr:site-specific DNA-methyltransferase [Methylobacterium sp.]